MSMGLFSFTKTINTVEFLPHNEWLLASDANPVVATTKIPRWYKELKTFIAGTDFPYKAHATKDLKLCAPYRDAMTYGYFLITPCEIEVTRMADGTPEFSWNSGYPHQVIDVRGDVTQKENQGYGMPVPIGCSPIMFAFRAAWGIKLPKGYSSLVTQPLNRDDLPFQLTSGIIDSDVWPHGGNIPFFLKDSAIGIIPKGTPFAQIIPLKREPWRNVIVPVNQKENDKLIIKKDTFISGYYVKHLRQKKEFK